MLVINIHPFFLLFTEMRREIDLLSIGSVFEMATIARLKPGPGTPTSYHKCIAETQVLEPSSVAWIIGSRQMNIGFSTVKLLALQSAFQ